mmetsp:Transcript_9172/g.21628  ORF Transcript_9172/g.21628 Transcript_9172/m.21628 type:complete len:362 (+) Transcript_9172:155-1240(+)
MSTNILECCDVVERALHVFADLLYGTGSCERHREDRFQAGDGVIALLACHALAVVPILLNECERAPELGQVRHGELDAGNLLAATDANLTRQLQELISQNRATQAKVRVDAKAIAHLLEAQFARVLTVGVKHLPLLIPVAALEPHRAQALVHGCTSHRVSERHLLRCAGCRVDSVPRLPLAAVRHWDIIDVQRVGGALVMVWRVVVVDHVPEARHRPGVSFPCDNLHKRLSLRNNVLVAAVALEEYVEGVRIRSVQKVGQILLIAAQVRSQKIDQLAPLMFAVELDLVLLKARLHLLHDHVLDTLLHARLGLDGHGIADTRNQSQRTLLVMVLVANLHKQQRPLRPSVARLLGGRILLIGK